MQIKKHNELLNSFDLKGSTYRRKVIDDQELRSLLDQNYINKKSVDHVSSEDSRKMGETMNKTNIAQKLLVHGEGEYSRRKSSNYHGIDKNSNKEDDEDAEEKLLRVMEMNTKQNILRTFGQRTLKDVDYEQLVRKKVLSLAISEEDVTLIMSTLKRDLAFLNENSLMDYSLLLGIEKINNVK